MKLLGKHPHPCAKKIDFLMTATTPMKRSLYKEAKGLGYDGPLKWIGSTTDEWRNIVLSLKMRGMSRREKVLEMIKSAKKNAPIKPSTLTIRVPDGCACCKVCCEATCTREGQSACAASGHVAHRLEVGYYVHSERKCSKYSLCQAALGDDGHLHSPTSRRLAVGIRKESVYSGGWWCYESDVGEPGVICRGRDLDCHCGSILSVCTRGKMFDLVDRCVDGFHLPFVLSIVGGWEKFHRTRREKYFRALLFVFDDLVASVVLEYL
jgi:hypothetical protein